MNKETIDRRVQRAVERILDDESLTSGLEDAPAQVLINWGVAEVERQARRIATAQDEGQFAAALDQAVSRVRQTIKRVAKTACQQGIAAPAELTQMLAQTLSEVEAAEAAKETEGAEAAKGTEAVVLPSAVDLVAPPPPAQPEPVVLPAAVDLVDQEPPRRPGLVARLFQFFGFKGDKA